MNGLIEPGSLTALMVATCAEKTTTLDFIAQRTSVGTFSGRICVDGKQRDSELQRKTGYAQQQDVHLPTSTVREALTFSALMRQPKRIRVKERLAYVEEILDVLDMKSYADAIVGVPGVGLNVVQRRFLTIGLELAARLELFLFLDEPTSGLDSQSAWNICLLLRKLADNGQAILCTIHQLSSTLLQMFVRLLLIGKEGRTIYSGPLGKNGITLVRYLESKGARRCAPDENPAEWMMEVTHPTSLIGWFKEWQNSYEKATLLEWITSLKPVQRDLSRATANTCHQEFATSFSYQVRHLIHRTFVEYWRAPSFLWAKFLLTCGASLAIAFSCWRTPSSLQGLQTQIFAVFVFFTLLSNMFQQIVPQYTERRSFFEAREGPAKIFSWKAFLLSAMVTEAICQVIFSVFAFAFFYYSIGMQINQPDDQKTERAALMFLLFLLFFLFTSTFAHLMTVRMEHRETIVNIGSLFVYLILMFCGVLVHYDDLPRFWTFMYWLSPLTYMVRGMISVGVVNKLVECSDIELFRITAPNGTGCGNYLDAYVSSAGGTIINPQSEDLCEFCPLQNTNTLLAQFKIEYSQRWSNTGNLCIYILFNILATYLVYWLVRVPKRQKMVEVEIVKRIDTENVPRAPVQDFHPEDLVTEQP
ncbi:putative ATP-binding cassette transporter [Corynespora cassiicola Philippines]|uniref:Putative ATP-binding cassette transporter n=1 Tax=Corynespora cassiicola Philippines TaxID=1448308 RepID=A0A2T2P5C6_CORCC|nr:putative ATP-binding cassette transporter [Corynespora cassiicola Philippines]